MCTLEGDTEVALPNQAGKNSPNHRTLQHTDGSAHSQKDPAIRRWGWRSLQMLYQRGGNLVGQWQFQGRGNLALADSQAALSPANIIERHGHHLTDAQSVCSNQQDHRVVAQSHRRGSVDGSQKGADRLPGESAWQLLELVKARRINLAGQSAETLSSMARNRRNPLSAPMSCCRLGRFRRLLTL